MVGMPQAHTGELSQTAPLQPRTQLPPGFLLKPNFQLNKKQQAWQVDIALAIKMPEQTPASMLVCQKLSQMQMQWFQVGKPAAAARKTLPIVSSGLGASTA